MDIMMAPIQQPKPKKTIKGSRIRRVKRKGRVGVIDSRARAMCAPNKRAPRERVVVRMRTARRAIKEYPPFRWMVEDMDGEGVVELGCDTGVGRLLESARKASRMKLEKEVKLPQKPVARPM